MSGKHTPGPWYAGAIRTHGAIPAMNGCDIGAMNGSNVAIALHQPEDREPAETVANARLIAAAPDLLAQLKFAARVLSGLPGIGNTAQIESMRALLRDLGE